MTDPEWAYLYQEFLGTLLGSDRPPTEREKQMALVWADEQFRRIKTYEDHNRRQS